MLLQGPDGSEVKFLGKRRILPTCLITAIAAEKLLGKGYQAFLAQVTDIRVAGLRLEDVPIVNEFPDVFPKELPGLPADHELEFAIYLLPGTASIWIPPYRMAPTELKELQVQLQDLVDKAFVRPSVSP